MKKNTLKENIIYWGRGIFLIATGSFIFYHLFACKIYNTCPSKNRIDRQRLLDWKRDDLREEIKKSWEKLDQHFIMPVYEIPEVNLID